MNAVGYGLAFAAGFLVALIWDALCKVINKGGKA